MGGYYINFCFDELCYNDDEITGNFSSDDFDVYCSFSYSRVSGKCDIYNNNKPVEEIEPLPIWFLLRKLKETGELNERESRICY